MTDILFGQSYYLHFDSKLFTAMKPYPPLGTLYAASYLRALGRDVDVFDAMLARSEEDWASALDLHRPRIAVLYEDSFNYLSKMCLLRMRQAAFAMIHLARQRGCTVVVSGSDATDHLTDYFAHGADYILIGEGEVTLGELMAALDHDVNLSNVRGLAYCDSRGAVIRTTPRDFIRHLDELPLPAWDLVDLDQYRRIWRERHGYFSINVVTTRGCPYHCNWCAKPIYGQRYNIRTPENVVAEIQRLKECYQPDHIEFVDDIFGLKPGWIERYAELVNARHLKTPFKCLMRADLVDARIADALARAGCQTVWMGAESGSQKILDAMDKGTRVEQIYAATKWLQREGIKVGFFLQYGYRGEVRRDIEMTLQMVRDCQPNDIGISVSYPLPGTKFHAQVQAELGEKQNWIDSDDLAMMYRGTYPPEFYRVLYQVTHLEFRIRRAWQSRGKNWRALATIPIHALKLARARRKLNALEKRDTWRRVDPSTMKAGS